MFNIIDVHNHKITSWILPLFWEAGYQMCLCFIRGVAGGLQMITAQKDFYFLMLNVR